jgi:hypothetical protein
VRKDFDIESKCEVAQNKLRSQKKNQTTTIAVSKMAKTNTNMPRQCELTAMPMLGREYVER